jgi:hypothetical protein
MNAHLAALIKQAKPERDIADAIYANETCHNSMGLGYEGDDCHGYYGQHGHGGCCPRNPENCNAISVCFRAWQGARTGIHRKRVAALLMPEVRVQWALEEMAGFFERFADECAERIGYAAGVIP